MSNTASALSLSGRRIAKSRSVIAVFLSCLVGLVMLSVKSTRSDSAPAVLTEVMPALEGEKAIEHLKGQGTYGSLQEAMAAVKYEAKWQTSPKLQGLGAGYEVANRANNLLAYVMREGLHVTALDDDKEPWRMGLSLKEYGYGYALVPVTAGEAQANNNRVVIKRNAALTEWFVNSSNGIEHGVNIAAPPGERIAGAALRLRFEVSGDLQATVNEAGNTAYFQLETETKTVLLSYDKLYVRDAKGRSLKTAMKMEAGALFIEVDDSKAEYPLTIDPTLTQQQKLTASDGASNDNFGSSVSVHQDTAVIGAPGDDLSQGSANAFIRLGSTWFGPQRLIANDGEVADHFGASVAITENTIVVGADGDNQGQGAAYVFTRSGGSWTQQQKLTASDAATNDTFGVSVAISGDSVVVGARGDNSNRGAAYVFTRSGTSWTQQAKLTASDGLAGDELGISVSISGDTVVAGSHLDDVGTDADQGSAYVYKRSGATWSQQQKLTVSGGAADDEFGISVAISGDAVVVGAFLDDVGGNSNEGSAHVFTRSGTTWSFDQTLNGSDTNTGDRFGNAVSISGDSIVVGAPFADTDVNLVPGAAYLFFNINGTWFERVKLIASDGAPVDQLGGAVALEGDTVVVGAAFDDVGTDANQGSAYIFPCLEQVQLTASDGAANDNFGDSVSIDGDTALVGSPGDSSAYVFVRNGAAWTQQAKLSGGGKVAIDGNTALVGNRVYVRSGTTWTLQQALSAGSSGRGVAIDGNTAVVGTFDSTSGSGGATFFVRSGTTWTEQDSVVVFQRSSFGSSVAVSGNTVIVGSTGTIFPTETGGRAYIYVRSGTTWTQQEILNGSLNFGQAVSISGNTALVGGGSLGGSGTATVFVRSGTAWSFQAELDNDDSSLFGDDFGKSVSINGNTAVVGEPGDDVDTNRQGSVYVFTRNGTNWEKQRFLTANDESVRFGASVGISGETILAGDPEADIGAHTAQGAAYVFFDACNSAPSIVPVSSVAVEQSGVANATIATVSDMQDLDADLTVTVAPPISSTISLTNIVNTGGTITAKISAICTAALGNNSITLRVQDSHGATSTAPLTVNVTCQTITVNPSTIATGTGGVAYSQTFTQTGCNASVTFFLSGTLPAGLSFNGSTGILSGTPTQLGNFPITVTATNSANCSGSRNYTLKIFPSFLEWVGSSSSNWHTAANWDQFVTPQPYHFVIIPSGAIPNEPIISNNSSTISALVVQTGRTLTINATRQLTAEDDVLNDGRIQGAGKLICKGDEFKQNGTTSVAAVEFAPGSDTLEGTGAFQSNTITVLSGVSVTLITNHSLSRLVINSGGSFNITNRTLIVTGAGLAITNQGSFTSTGSTIVYQGSAAQAATANSIYNNLTINNPAGVSLAGNTTVNGVLNLTTDLTTGLFVLSMPPSGTSTGAGDVAGNVKRTGFTTSNTLSFGNPNNTISFTSGTVPTDVIMNLVKSPPTGFNGTVARAHTITPTGGSGFIATVRLHYKDIEATGLNETTFELWRFNGSSWESPLGVATRDTAANWVQEAGITAFSPWTIADSSGPICGVLTPNSQFFGVQGAEGSIVLTALASCGWTASSNAGWLEITSTESGSGSDVVTYIVRDNFAPIPRQGTLTIAGQTFTVVQDSEAAPDCVFNISAAFAAFNASGGAGSLDVITEERCAWQGVSDSSWITITSISCGIGNGTITYSVAANPGPSGRSGTIRLGGQVFAIKQKGQ